MAAERKSDCLMSMDSLNDHDTVLISDKLDQLNHIRFSSVFGLICSFNIHEFNNIRYCVIKLEKSLLMYAYCHFFDTGY